MRTLLSALTFLVVLGAGLDYAGGIGRLFAYLDGTEYLHSLSLMVLFWPVEVQTWAVYALLTFGTGAMLFRQVLRKVLSAEQLPGLARTMAVGLVAPSTTFLLIALLAIPTYWVGEAISGLACIGLAFMTTAMLVKKLLLKSAPVQTLRVAEYLAWAYLPLPLILSLVAPI
jgi:hypothetical protein